MTTDFKYKTYKIEDFIELVKQKKDRTEGYDPDYYYQVYGDDEGNGLALGMPIYISDSIEVNDDDEEIYPSDVMNKKLSPLYSCTTFQDVIDLALRQDPKVAMEKLIECLNYYSEHDNFLDVK
jgi:hypothetical protein